MKKLIISCAVLFSAAMFMSCNNDPNAPHCWELTTSIYSSSEDKVPTQTTTQYVWGTNTELRETMNSIIQQMQATGQMDYRLEFKRVNKSQADCQ